MRLKKKIICFDLDNTICDTEANIYTKSKPIKKNIKIINSLFNNGYYIKIFTSRYMGRSNETPSIAKKRGYTLTVRQLNNWKVKYHKLIFGKPSYDLFVDDKALFFRKNWTKELSKILK